MFEDDDSRKKPVAPKDLEPLSINELTHYIEGLKEEIIRVEEEVLRKKKHMEAASSVFK